MTAFAGRPAKPSLGWTAALVLGLSSAAHPVWSEPGAGLPKPSPAVSEVSGGVRYELDRVLENGETVLVFKSGEPGHPASGAPLSVQARSLDRLLARQATARPLPAHFQVRFGDAREALVTALQARLSRPGVNWDTRLGRARSGASGPVIQKALVEIVAASPLPPVFGRHGYRLHLDDMARIEVGHPPSTPNLLLPVEVGEMDFSADGGR